VNDAGGGGTLSPPPVPTFIAGICCAKGARRRCAPAERQNRRCPTAFVADLGPIAEPFARPTVCSTSE